MTEVKDSLEISIKKPFSKCHLEIHIIKSFTYAYGLVFFHFTKRKQDFSDYLYKHFNLLGRLIAMC